MENLLRELAGDSAATCFASVRLAGVEQVDAVAVEQQACQTGDFALAQLLEGGRF